MPERKLRVLVTAGCTKAPIDNVRMIETEPPSDDYLTNLFKGNTGTAIAMHFANKGNNVTLLTSNPAILPEFIPVSLDFIVYKTFNELLQAMEKEISSGQYDIIIHSSAVGDYENIDVQVPNDQGALISIDKSGKVSSDFDIVHLILRRTTKIIDLIRDSWGFKGYLVKFKLQVGMTDDELLAIAKKSRNHSKADMIVANCLEWSKDYAYICTCNQTTRRKREDLPEEIETRIRKDMLWESE